MKRRFMLENSLTEVKEMEGMKEAEDIFIERTDHNSGVSMI